MYLVKHKAPTLGGGGGKKKTRKARRETVKVGVYLKLENIFKSRIF